MPTVGGLAWRQHTSAPSERSEVAATAVGQKIYVAGGFAGDGSSVDTVEVYDAATDRWEAAPPLPVPVNHAMAATFDGVVYVFGGYDGTNRATRGANRLDGGTWRSLAKMPKGRGAGAAVAIGSQIYVVGGVESGADPATDMLVYTPGSDSWSVQPAPPTPREHLGAAGSGGKLFVVGGRASGRGNFAAFEVFDPATSAWSTLPPMPTARGGLAAVGACNGYVVAVGGEAEETFPEAEAFDVERGTWHALPDVPTARHGLGVVAVGSSVYVVGGGAKPGLFVSGANESLDLSSLGPCR